MRSLPEGGGYHPGGEGRSTPNAARAGLRPAAGVSLLVFVHVPKAAGTTLHRVIEDQYPPARILDFADPERAEQALSTAAPETLAEIEVLKGHVYYGVHRHFQQPPRYVTLLRHPVARVASHYRYVRNKPDHYLHTAVVEGDLDLAAYAQGTLSRELRNGQVQMFSARARELDECDEGCLEEATRVLADEFAVVGLAERFDESLLLMQESLGWSSPYYVPENRSSESGSAVTEEEVAAIEAANRFDLALYDFAAGRLAERLAADPGLPARVERFRRRNRLLGPAGRILRPARAAARRRA